MAHYHDEHENEYDLRAKAEPAPSPPADIAGLVERLNHLVSLNEPRHGGPYAGTAAEACVKAMGEAASALTRIAQERDAATQLNNKYAWERDKAREERDAAERRSEAFWKPQLAAAEARVSSARDEGLEMAAALAETHPKYRPAGWSGDPTCHAIAAAIRALKAPTEGTKP